MSLIIGVLSVPTSDVGTQMAQTHHTVRVSLDPILRAILMTDPVQFGERRLRK